MDVKERILLFISFKRLSIRSFEEKCSLSNGYIKAMRKGFGPDKLSNVLQEFPELNREWLLYGEGEMLKPSSTSQTITTNNGLAVANNGGSINYHQGGSTPQSEVDEADAIPIVPPSIYGEQGVDVYEYVQTNEVNMSPRIRQLPTYDMCYLVLDNEMSPLISNGDKLLLSAYNVGEERKAINGRIYVIDTRTNGLLVRRVVKQEEGLAITAINPKYPEDLIEWDEIIRVYRIVGLLRRVVDIY